MKKIFATIIAFAMLSVMVPGVNAHTGNAGYDIPAGPSGNTGGAVSTRLCAEEWDEGALSDSGDELVFGPAGFDEDDNPDDLAHSVACGGVRDAWADDGIKMGVYSAGIEAADDFYTTFVVTVSDDNFDATYFSFCVFTGGDNLCETDSESETFQDPDGAVDYAVQGCGTGQVSTAGELAGGPDNGPSAFVYATYVDSDTFDVCLGSSGVVTVVMS